jgi:enoyl-CoA hydratase/carnithine racemase
MPMEYRSWKLSKENQILTLTIQGADPLNTLNFNSMIELQEITAQLHDDDDTRVVILQGEGRHFSSGLDIQMLSERMDYSVEDNRRFIADMQRCVDDFETLEKPTVAKLHGFCLGGGLMLALCCDFRIASKRTIFSLPEIKLGLPILWGTKRLIRLVGISAAKEILYLGNRFKASQALQYGLVHQVVAPDELDQTTSILARHLSDVPAKALELSKRIIHAGYDLPLRESQDLELEIVADLLASPETKHAFVQYVKNQGLLDKRHKS